MKEAECIQFASCPGAQPVYVGWNNPRFRHARSGYVPAYCPACPDYERGEPAEVIGPVFRPRLVDKEIDQLKAQVNYLTNKLAERRALDALAEGRTGGRAKPRFTGVI